MYPEMDINTHNYLYCDYDLKKRIPVRTITKFSRYYHLAVSNRRSIPKYKWYNPSLTNIKLACSPLIVIDLLEGFKETKNNPKVWQTVTDTTWTKKHYDSARKIDETGLFSYVYICYNMLSYYFIFSG